MNALIDFHSNNVSPNPTLSKMNRKQNHRKIKKDDKRKKKMTKTKETWMMFYLIKVRKLMKNVSWTCQTLGHQTKNYTK